MARLIAVDTSTRVTGVGLYAFDPSVPEEGTLEGCQVVEQDRMHAEGLLDVMDALLKEQKRTVSEVDGFLIAVGPGSFTGLRIGVTMMKTMAQFTNKPVMGISTLEALAREGRRFLEETTENPSETVIVPIIDARGKRIYAGAQDTSGQWILPEDLYFEEDFAQKLLHCRSEMPSGEWAARLGWAGEGIESHPLLRKTFSSAPSITLPGEAAKTPIRALCELGAIRFSQGDTDSVFDLAPHYLRRSQAEMDRSARCRD